MRTDYYLQIEYNLVSHVPEYEPDRYVNRYHLKVSASTLQSEDDNYEEIGKGLITLILEGLAINHQYDLFDVFDCSQSTLELGERIYDFEHPQIKEELQQHFNYEIFDPNVLFLERLELMKNFRGLGIGKRVIKDIIERFSGCAGLIVLKAYPLQFEGVDRLNNKWVEKIELDDLEKDEEKAKYKLYSYYQNLGFQSPFNDGYFFINPAWINEKMDKVGLE